MMGGTWLAASPGPGRAVVFFLRVVGRHWHIESGGVMGSHFSFKTSLWLLSGEWPVGGEGEAQDGSGEPIAVVPVREGAACVCPAGLRKGKKMGGLERM